MTAKFLFSATAAAALLLAPTLSLAAPLSDPQRQEIAETINAYAPRMQEVASTIWHNPELGYLETETAALLQGELSAHGFAIDRGVAGIPTAFVASRGSADGPVIAILAEMDALPGFSQTASPTQQPMDALTAGHALRPPSVRRRIRRRRHRRGRLSGGPWSARSGPSLWHPRRRRRRRQGLSGARRAV